VIYVASQTLSTLLMSTTMDKTQRMVMLVMPLAFVFVVVNFPVGLVLYWLTTNLWTVGQGVVTRRLVPKGPAAPPKKTSRTPPRDGDGGGDGARRAPDKPKPAPAAAQPPRRVKRKKKKARR
jgi:YidC/Oxa1 family membrane protein insertase